MTDLLDGLNEQQKEAVTFDKGPLLILAGAGSGKTKTLTHRIAYLIAKKGVSPNQIMAVTFTNKAAKEMRERLANLLSSSAKNRTFMPFMGTFHSIAVRILRIYGEIFRFCPLRISHEARRKTACRTKRGFSQSTKSMVARP
jgi:DNA helicase-2/ATP-dependent DNA helicase PcrA